MGKKLKRLVLPALMFLLVSASEPPQNKITVAVYPIKVLASDKSFESLGPVLTSFLVAKLSKSAKLRVTEQEMTSEVEKQLEFANSDKCDSTMCPIPEIGKAMAAQKLVVGQVAKLGQKYTANIRVIDIEKKIIDFSVEEQFSGKEDDLDQLMEMAALDLREKFGEKVERPHPEGPNQPAGPALPQPTSSYQPRTYTPQNNADAYFKSGNDKATKSQWDLAIQDYNKAIELDPQYAEAYLARGNINIAKKQYDPALQDLGKAIELDPGNKLAYVLRGAVYQLKNQYKQAIQEYTKVIELDPNDAQYYYIRGLSYNVVGNRKLAEADFSKARELDPQRFANLK